MSANQDHLENLSCRDLLITGGNPLIGTINVSGSKNATLPIMCAALLTDEPVILSNVPKSLSDIKALGMVLRGLGVKVGFAEDETIVHAEEIRTHVVDKDCATRFRGSVLVMGPMLARHGRVNLPIPGGCAIGARPVDYHVKGLEAMGARIQIDSSSVMTATAPEGLRGTLVRLPKPSVGATENILMAACLANGTTILENAAQEPEVINLGELLVKMGASIEGLGTGTITIQGRAKLHGAVHSVIPDRIETATWMIACCLTGGTLHLHKTHLRHLSAEIEPLQAAGLDIKETYDGVLVQRNTDQILSGTDITTAPYPGFPTDLQAPIMVLLALCNGTATLTETIFESRFQHVAELQRMGAKIDLQTDTKALITGTPRLTGHRVVAGDLRGAAALVLAGLVANGETEIINGQHHLDRGYETLVEKLKRCGARISRMPKLDKTADDSSTINKLG